MGRTVQCKARPMGCTVEDKSARRSLDGLNSRATHSSAGLANRNVVRLPANGVPSEQVVQQQQRPCGIPYPCQPESQQPEHSDIDVRACDREQSWLASRELPMRSSPELDVFERPPVWVD